MYIPSPNEGGGDFAPVPAGTYLALCYRFIDLGTQKTVFQGQEKFAHKIMLSWELPDEYMNDGRPMMVSKRYTWSMHERSTLRKDLESWRGAPFVDRDFGPGGFDIKNILGKACLLTMVQDTRDGRTYANIASIGKVMKNMEIPHQTNPSAYLWIGPERWDQEVFNSLSDRLQVIIKSSPEYAELQQALRGNGGLPAQIGEVFPTDDIPF